MSLKLSHSNNENVLELVTHMYNVSVLFFIHHLDKISSCPNKQLYLSSVSCFDPQNNFVDGISFKNSFSHASGDL